MVEYYFREFLIKSGLSLDTKYYEAFKFGLNDHQADELLKLVLCEKKIATTSPYFEDEVIPKAGDLSVVLNSKGEPKCIIRTKSVKIMPFNEMTYDICKLEGEDEVLETWVYNHEIFLKESCKEKGVPFKEDMPIVFEIFEKIYE